MSMPNMWLTCPPLLLPLPPSLSLPLLGVLQWVLCSCQQQNVLYASFRFMTINTIILHLSHTHFNSFILCLYMDMFWEKRQQGGKAAVAYGAAPLSISLSRLIVYGVIKWRLLPQCVVDVSVIATSLLVSVSVCVCAVCVCEYSRYS